MEGKEEKIPAVLVAKANKMLAEIPASGETTYKEMLELQDPNERYKTELQKWIAHKRAIGWPNRRISRELKRKKVID